MADTVSMALAELVRKAEEHGDVDFLRDGVRVLSQALMEVEVSQHLGAERHERTAGADRAAERVPRAGVGHAGGDDRAAGAAGAGWRATSRACWSRGKRAEQALVAVVREAYVQGVSTRKVDELVQALGLDGISKSQVSRLCQALDEEVERFRARPLEGPYPYVWLDATFVKVRDGWAGRLDGGGDRDRRQRRRAARGARAGRGAERGRRVLAARSCAAWWRGASPGCSW